MKPDDSKWNVICSVARLKSCNANWSMMIWTALCAALSYLNLQSQIEGGLLEPNFHWPRSSDLSPQLQNEVTLS